MKRVLSVFFAVMFVFGIVCAAQSFTLEEAKELGEKAAAFVKANGKEKGATEIENPKGPFVKGNMELYVTLHDTKATFLASPAQPKMKGHVGWDLKDPAGKYFLREIVDLVKTKGSGWYTYTWTNPATKKIQQKKAWIQGIEGTDMFTMCGIFQ